MNIREASQRDLSQIVEYTLALHQHEDDGKIAANPHFSDNLSEWLSSELDSAQSLFLIAERKSNPVGFIGAMSIINDNGFLANPAKGLIQLLWVDEKSRNKNIAENLVKEVEHCFKRVGIEYVECNYTCVNNLAESFWSKLGYAKHSVTARRFI